MCWCMCVQKNVAVVHDMYNTYIDQQLLDSNLLLYILFTFPVYSRGPKKVCFVA